MDCSLPVSSVHGILQARILEWIAMPSSRGSSWRRDWTQVSCTAGRFFAVWATRKPISILKRSLKAASGLRKNTHKVMWLEKGLLFSHSVVSDSLWPHGLRHARLPRLSPSPEVCTNMIIESVTPSNHLILCRPLLLRLQSFPASGSFSMSQLFASDGQSTGASASASVLPMNIQGCLRKAGVSSHWRRSWCGLRIGGKDPWVPVPGTGSSMPGKQETMLWATSELVMGAGMQSRSTAVVSTRSSEHGGHIRRAMVR